PARALAVDADREPARLTEPADEVGSAVGLERAGRIVEKHARGAELRQLPRLLDQRRRLARDTRRVDEPAFELAAGRGGRLRSLPKVLDVVERIMEPEDVDSF